MRHNGTVDSLEGRGYSCLTLHWRSENALVRVNVTDAYVAWKARDGRRRSRLPGQDGGSALGDSSGSEATLPRRDPQQAKRACGGIGVSAVAGSFLVDGQNGRHYKGRTT